MKYIGEHLLPGQIGQFLLVLSLVSSFIASIAYFKATNAVADEDVRSWRRIGRIAFLVDAISVVLIFGIIYFIISNHYFEYYYAWNHSDKSLHPSYLLSSIWEGQEGSFLLWAIWHAVLGAILIRSAKKWEAPVMTIFSAVQLFLATMLLGIYVFDLKIGSNPFILTRQMFPTAPIFNDVNYLANARLQDGNGLNQLLQNYWMVIHPPVLFLGFASTLVPFAFAVSGLWKKDYGGWTRQAVPWSLFSAAILGLGIMMGARWAYESLNFGGYWAWDPVENASLVPWLLLIAGIHTQVIYNSTGHSLRATYFFFIAAFLLILYSSYLTKSGDLQDTSVHAFTDEGLNWQLRLFVLAFLVPSIGMFIYRYKQIPSIAKEESSYSREFWMFIGSLVLFLSGMYIIGFTSLPVINKVFGTAFTVGGDVEFFYNRILIFVAILLGILTAVTQYLRYKNTDGRVFFRKLWLPTFVSLVIYAAIAVFGNVSYDKYGPGYLGAIHVAIFAGVYAVVANASYIWTGLNGKLKAAGASIAHVGFGLMLVGMLIASSKKEVLSVNMLNPLNFGPDNKEKGTENLTLFQGIKTEMSGYWATYASDSMDPYGKKMLFEIQLEKKDGSSKFSLYPDLIKNTKGQQGFSNNPDAKHYWNRDIFTYVNYSDKMQDGEDTTEFVKSVVKPGDTIFYSSGYMVLEKVVANPKEGRRAFNEDDTALMAKLQVKTVDGRKFTATPLFYVTNNRINYLPDTIFAQGLAIGLTRVVDKERIEIAVKESTRLAPFIALKVLKFPFISLLWLGTILMMVGFVMSIRRRLTLMRKVTA
jgi:cytochrome c-type biogenesis protein CcmF